VIFRQITHDDLGCASYFVGDHSAGTAAVIDPRFEIDDYLELARYLSVSIDHVLETHNHADHVSGHGRLAAATGATIHVHRLANAEYEHEPFDDGYELELGSLTVRALHSPGHRPEHTAFALVDSSRGGDPWAVLTSRSRGRRAPGEFSTASMSGCCRCPLRPRFGPAISADRYAAGREWT
jgi:hydroxyacylglutathione hydrolase